MAKKTSTPGVNRSEAIRQYLRENPNATAKEIIPTLAERGIFVSQGLVNNVKYGKGKQVGRKKLVRKKTARGKRAVNRSKAIREYLADNPGVGYREVIAGLKARGITVSEGLVSNVKHSMKRAKKKIKRRVRRGMAAVAARRTAALLSADDLFKAKTLVDGVGSFDEARRAIDALEKLR